MDGFRRLEITHAHMRLYAHTTFFLNSCSELKHGLTKMVFNNIKHFAIKFRWRERVRERGNPTIKLKIFARNVCMFFLFEALLLFWEFLTGIPALGSQAQISFQPFSSCADLLESSVVLGAQPSRNEVPKHQRRPVAPTPSSALPWRGSGIRNIPIYRELLPLSWLWKMRDWILIVGESGPNLFQP